MKVIFIDPVDKAVKELDTIDVVNTLQSSLGSRRGEHHAISDLWPDHIGLVNALGLVKKHKLWFFNNVTIWGRMLIFGGRVDGFYQPPRVPLEEVRRLVRWQ